MRRLFGSDDAMKPSESSCRTPVLRPVPNMNITGLGKRPVLRVVVLQAACATLTGLAFLIFGGIAAATAGFIGGLIVAVGSALFGWRMYAPGVAAAGKLYRAMIAAESLKWLWYVLALWAALARLKLLPAPLVVGVVVGQFGHWLSLVVIKRGQ
jgi:F0F1-type ATP synthase assembly protein I